MRAETVPSSLETLRRDVDLVTVGHRMYELCETLYPICRSITGDGVRQSLDVLSDVLPIERHEVPTGTPVLDWTVPKEWNIRDAYVATTDGERVIDFGRSNLHVVGYSRPVRRRMSLDELRPHLHTLPDRPGAVPYRTSYYTESWGFCLSHDQLESMPDGDYDVVIDSTLADGSMTYGECVILGDVPEEVILTAHVCHPALANDNLSGMTLLALLGEHLRRADLHYTHRLLFIPGTIGSIAWLARNQANVGSIRHGLVLSGVGDGGSVSYKRSRRGDTDVDRAAHHVLTTSGDEHRIIDFHPYGYDERQFCSPGFNLPVGRFGRSPHNEYPEYHTSADDLGFIDRAAMADSFDKLVTILEVLDGNRTYLNTSPNGEPELGRRGLYRAIGGQLDQHSVEMALLWVLNYSDGEHDLLDIACRAGLPFGAVRAAADALADAGLLSDDDVR